MNEFNENNNQNNENQVPQQSWQPYQPPQNNFEPHGSWDFNRYDASNNNFAPKEPKKKSKLGLKIIVGFVCVALILTTIGFAGYGIYSAFNPIQAQSDNTSSNYTASVPSIVLNNNPESSSEVISTGGKLNGEAIYEKVSPSIVGILSYQSEYSSEAGSGSGIIISSDGYIVTNAHVIEGGQLIEVVLNNDERYKAKVIGSDARTDLAVIKIDANNLVVASLGNSDQLKPGETVFAIGNPGGLEFANSITDGMVSGIDRLVTSETGYTMKYIQTNAAINPGNSGGALVNEYGYVIGICSAKIMALDYEGIGFAIPITEAKDILDSLMINGFVKGRPRLGITFSLVSSTYAMYYSTPTGVMVESIDKNSSAYKAGLRAGDIITKFDGVKIDSTEQVLQLMEKHKPNDVVVLTVFRRPNNNTADQTFELKVTLDEDNGQTGENYESREEESSPSQPNYSNPYGEGGYTNPWDFFNNFGFGW